MDQLTHLNTAGEAHMVDISHKNKTKRCAITIGSIFMQASTLNLILSGEVKKGDVFACARIAGIMAAKKTAETIPLCHQIPLSKIDITILPELEKSSIKITTTVETTFATGVEIEALLATQIALLTIYDMCKAVDRGMVMTDIQLQHKSGGQSGTWDRDNSQNHNTI